MNRKEFINGGPATELHQSGIGPEGWVDPGLSAGSGGRSSAGFHQKAATATRLTLLVLAVTAFLHFAHAVVLPVVAAWVVATALNPLMRRLRSWRLPAPIAAISVMGIVLVPISFGFGQISRPLVAWSRNAPQNIEQLKERLHLVLRPARRITEMAATVGEAAGATGESVGAVPKVEVKDHAFAGTLFSWTATALTSLGETLALIFLLLCAEDTFIQKLVKVMPTLRDKRRAVGITNEIRHSVSVYLFSVSLVNLCLGTVLAIALTMAGMRDAVMWGALAALMNFIPYFGPIVGVSLMAIGGLTAFDTLGHGLVPAAIYLALHLVEANLVTPFVVGRRFTLNPVVVFASLIFFLWLWGGVGALVAMPLLVAAKTICDRLPALSSVGEILSN